MYKTKIYSKTITTTPSKITDDTIKTYSCIQAVNDTGVSLRYTYNSDTVQGEVKNGDVFYNTCYTETSLLNDVIWMSASSTVTLKVEIQYWEA